MNSGSSKKARKPPAFTKTGDEGMTGLVGGRRVRKSSARVRAYGEIDELNSILGLAAEFVKTTLARRLLLQIQRDLFVLGSELACPIQSAQPATPSLPTITPAMLSDLEKETEKLHEELPVLRNFILPGGTYGASLLHLARAVTRRAEREVVGLSEIESLPALELQYLNRLSSLLFELARYENQKSKRKEEIWSGKLQSKIRS
jgi:cob(I)alamin adenosyltransferase